jgi:5-hydroxyisourate hydrolase
VAVSLSTHVLDTERGRPGSGVRVELRRGGEVVARAETDGDGRARLAEELQPGRYLLAFEPPSPYFRRVELELELEDGHHHVPLLVSSYGCSTYRGS